MSRDLGRDVPDLEKLYARKLWADFSYPRHEVCALFSFTFPSNYTLRKVWEQTWKSQIFFYQATSMLSVLGRTVPTVLVSGTDLAPGPSRQRMFCELRDENLPKRTYISKKN